MKWQLKIPKDKHAFLDSDSLVEFYNSYVKTKMSILVNNKSLGLIGIFCRLKYYSIFFSKVDEGDRPKPQMCWSHTNTESQVDSWVLPWFETPMMAAITAHPELFCEYFKKLCQTPKVATTNPCSKKKIKQTHITQKMESQAKHTSLCESLHL